MNSFSACYIFTCDGATLSGGRWETLTFMFTLDCAMYTDMWTVYTSMLGMFGGVYALTLWQMSM